MKHSVKMRRKDQKTISQPLQRSIVRSHRAVFFLYVCTVFIVFGNGIGNEFVFDDIPLVVENELIRSIENIPVVIGIEEGVPQYRPVRIVSYMIDYAIGGMTPAVYHVFNYIYHGLTAFIVYLVLQELMGAWLIAVAGGMLFIAHPIVTDSVTYISGRRDILVALFYVLGFYYFVRYRKRGGWWYPVLMVMCFLLALGSKEMAVTFPVVCMLYDFTVAWAELESSGSMTGKMKKAMVGVFRQHWKMYVPVVLIGGYYFYDKVFVHYPSLKKGFYGGDAVSNFSTTARIICHYIKLVFFPVVLHADYSYNAFPLSRSFFEVGVLGAVAAVGGIVWIVVRWLERDRWVFFGGMWFFVTLLPVCQIFPHHELMAEHYVYLPLVGVIMVFARLWWHIVQRKRVLGVVVVSLLFVLFSVRTVERNRDWRDGMTLWGSVLKRTPECARAHDNMGTEYFKRKEYASALSHYQWAVRIRPDHAIFHNNLGMAYGALGDIENARKAFEKAIMLNPQLAKSYVSLGMIFCIKKDYEKAVHFFARSTALQRGIIRKMGSAAALFRFSVAKIMSEKGEMELAIGAYKWAIHLKPDYVEAYQELAILYRKTGEQGKLQEIQDILETLIHKK